MIMEFRRKLYTRGSSYETTIPRALLFSIDKQKKYEVVFVFEPTSNKWFIEIKDRETENERTE